MNFNIHFDQLKDGVTLYPVMCPNGGRHWKGSPIIIGDPYQACHGAWFVKVIITPGDIPTSVSLEDRHILGIPGTVPMGMYNMNRWFLSEEDADAYYQAIESGNLPADYLDFQTRCRFMDARY